MRKDYDSIKYIKEPYESVQEAAVNISYDALRYINTPCYKAELAAIKNNEMCIRDRQYIESFSFLYYMKIFNIKIIKQ